MTIYIDMPATHQSYRNRCNCGLNPRHFHNQPPLYIRHPIPYQPPYTSAFYHSEVPVRFAPYPPYGYVDDVDFDEVEYIPPYCHQVYRRKSPKYYQKNPLEDLLAVVTHELDRALSLNYESKPYTITNSGGDHEYKPSCSSKKQRKLKDHSKQKVKDSRKEMKVEKGPVFTQTQSDQDEPLGQIFRTFVEKALLEHAFNHSHHQSVEENESCSGKVPGAVPSQSTKINAKKIIIQDATAQQKQEKKVPKVNEENQDQDDAKSEKSESSNTSKESDGDSMIERLQKRYDPIVSAPITNSVSSEYGEHEHHEDWEKVKSLSTKVYDN